MLTGHDKAVLKVTKIDVAEAHLVRPFVGPFEVSIRLQALECYRMRKKPSAPELFGVFRLVLAGSPLELTAARLESGAGSPISGGLHHKHTAKSRHVRAALIFYEIGRRGFAALNAGAVVITGCRILDCASSDGGDTLPFTEGAGLEGA